MASPGYKPCYCGLPCELAPGAKGLPPLYYASKMTKILRLGSDMFDPWLFAFAPTDWLISLGLGRSLTRRVPTKNMLKGKPSQKCQFAMIISYLHAFWHVLAQAFQVYTLFLEAKAKDIVSFPINILSGRRGEQWQYSRFEIPEISYTHRFSGGRYIAL